MSGCTLYLLYVRAMANLGVDVDAWEDLDPVDRNAWSDVADQVIFPEEAPHD